MTVKIICNQIKDKLKEKGITQDDFAKMMGVSSPTIKRWLKAEGLLFKDLTLMLEKLNVRLSEMAILSEASMINNFTYTKNQEEIFINTEGLLAFFEIRSVLTPCWIPIRVGFLVCGHTSMTFET